jgi:hypothetical protein
MLSSPRRNGTRGSQVGVGLALFAATLLVVVATPWSSARAAEDNEAPKAAAPEANQAEDTDRPHDKSLLAKQPADAAVAQKGQADQEAFYEKWQFWAVTGAIVVGAVGLIVGGSYLYHSANGGDVRPCNSMFIGCYGQGEPQ